MEIIFGIILASIGVAVLITLLVIIIIGVSSGKKAVKECADLGIKTDRLTLKRLAKANTFAFQRSLMLANYTVISQIITANSYQEAQSVAILAALLNGHEPYAADVMNYLRRIDMRPEPLTNIRVMPNGIYARLDNQRILVGTRNFLVNNRVTGIPPINTNVVNVEQEVNIASNGIFVGTVYFSRPLDKKASAILPALRTMGVQHTIIVDNKLANMSPENETTCVLVGNNLAAIQYKDYKNLVTVEMGNPNSKAEVIINDYDLSKLSSLYTISQTVKF